MTAPTPAAPTSPGPADADKPLPVDVHPAWLPPDAFRAIGSRRVHVHGSGLLVETVASEVARACALHAGSWVRTTGDLGRDLGRDPTGNPARDPATGAATGAVGSVPADLVLRVAGPGRGTGPEGYTLHRSAAATVVEAHDPPGLLYGFFHAVRLGEQAFGAHDAQPQVHGPALARRMLDHWDNVEVHPFMGQVERGYAGGSIFWRAGRLREDVARMGDYARLLAACGINAVSVNNVNVHRTEALLLTERLDDVVTLADLFRPYGIRTHLAVTFAAPVVLGGLPTADPLEPAVRDWWRRTTQAVYARIPDFGGYVVKADSEGQPGPYGYGRTHADGANALAEAVAPHGGTVHWRAFVYNHRQDWRDRRTDRANAAYDAFTPHDGAFHDAVVVQVKHGPIDFQPREPVSPLIGSMPRTRLAVELQVTQEYTGQQRHVCYLAPMWSHILRFRFRGDADEGSAVGRITRGGGLVAVSNVGDDRFWTGHPLAQANLYAYGRLAWDPDADASALLDEWAALTFPAAGPDVVAVLHAMMDRSWLTYEKYTAPLGIGFMVDPSGHYGPAVDGYEYSPWGTYHFADRDGVGVDRTLATGTGFAARFPQPWSQVYESLDTCPDELLLFFHHVPYGHRLHDGSTVLQHIYDTHFDGAREAEELAARWDDARVQAAVGPDLHARVRERLAEQVHSAREWCDQVNSYFFRKSGVPDAHGRPIY